MEEMGEEGEEAPNGEEKSRRFHEMPFKAQHHVIIPTPFRFSRYRKEKDTEQRNDMTVTT